MDGLPTPLLDDILLRIDPQSLAMIRCTSKSLELHTYNQYFQSEYFSRLGSGLLHISSYGSRWLCYQSYKDSKSLRTEHALMECRILGYCSGIFLLFIDGLCVANPFTKKFRFLTHPGSKRFSKNPTHFGLAVDQIDRNTQNFKIVHITKARKGDETTYGFWINNEDSWRYSKSNITCHSSNIGNLMKTPVYLHGSLHWLRNDGSIIAFNPDTEQARLIQIKFPEEVSLKTFFAASDNNVSLILATEEVIFVYALTNISNDPTWVLVKKIQNGVLDKRWLVGWNIEAYDSKYLVLREDTSKKGYDRVVHVYDLRANEWVVLGNIPKWCDANRDFFQVTPSLSYVVGLDEILAYGDKRISTLSSIIGLIKGLSTEEVEKQIRKRSIEEEEVKEMLAEESSSEEVGKQIRKVSIGEEKKKLVWLENLKFSNVQRSKRSKRRRRVI